MGASGTFEDALAGVTAFDEASRKESRDAKKGKKKKHKSEKEKHRKSDHKEKKDKKKKKHKRKDSSSDSDSEDERDPMSKLPMADQIDAGRAAARVIRELKIERPDVPVQDLREVSVNPGFSPPCCANFGSSLIVLSSLVVEPQTCDEKFEM